MNGRIRPSQSGKKCLHEHNSQKDKAVQRHSHIQDHGLKTLPLFYDNFARAYCHGTAFHDECHDACDCHPEDAQGVNCRDDDGGGFCLIKLQEDAAQNASKEVYRHMQQDRIFQSAGLYVDEGEKAA